MSGSQHWWRKPFRVFQTNLRETDADLDVAAVLDHITGIGANTWLLNTAGIVAFYPSRLSFQHPSPWLARRPSGDLIKDAIRQAHERDVRVISRLDMSKIHREIAEANPDWCFVDRFGDYQIYNGLYSTCPSGPYYGERLLDILTEVLDECQPDGFFFNMFNFNQLDYSGVRHGVCQCLNCAMRFRERHGLELPTEEDLDDPVYLEWLDYTRTTLAERSTSVRELIKRHSPDIGLFMGTGGDVDFREANNAVDRPEPLWVHWAGELVRGALGHKASKPVVVNSVMFLDIPYRFTAEQPGLVGLHLAQTMAHGGSPMAYVVGTNEVFRPQAYEVVREVLTFHRDHQDLYADLSSAARVAIVSSRRSMEAYGGSAGAEAVLKERRGLYRALVHAHIPFDIISDDDLEASTPSELLARYDVLVLPNVAALSDEQGAKLDAYVDDGGGLVATFDTGSFTEAGTPRSEIALSSLGASRILTRHAGRTVRSAYLRLPEDGNQIGPNRLVALDRAFNVVSTRPDAETFGTFVPASRYGPPEKCHWQIETHHPGLVWYRHGKGRTAYIPWPVGALYHDLSLVEYRGLVATAIKQVNSHGLQLRTTAPPQVELTVGRQVDSGRTLVHAVNYSGHNGRSFTDPLTLRDISITLAGGTGSVEAKSARAVRLNLALPVEHTEHGVTVTLPTLDLFELIVLE